MNKEQKKTPEGGHLHRPHYFEMKLFLIIL